MRIFVPSTGPGDWQRLLGEPEKHWKAGRSAMEAAYSWEISVGFPERVRSVLDTSDVPALTDLEPILGLPEFLTPLPGGSRMSQTDLLVLARGSTGLVVIGVEAKVDETFGPLVSEWLVSASPGKLERLAYLCEVVGLAPEAAGAMRYQLLHRTASSIIEAERFGAGASVMLVHSFSPVDAGFTDYATFVTALGGSPNVDAVSSIGEGRFCAWVTDRPRAERVTGG